MEARKYHSCIHKRHTAPHPTTQCPLKHGTCIKSCFISLCIPQSLNDVHWFSHTSRSVQKSPSSETVSNLSSVIFVRNCGVHYNTVLLSRKLLLLLLLLFTIIGVLLLIAVHYYYYYYHHHHHHHHYHHHP